MFIFGPAFPLKTLPYQGAAAQYSPQWALAWGALGTHIFCLRTQGVTLTYTGHTQEGSQPGRI